MGLFDDREVVPVADVEGNHDGIRQFHRQQSSRYRHGGNANGPDQSLTAQAVECFENGGFLQDRDVVGGAMHHHEIEHG